MHIVTAGRIASSLVACGLAVIVAGCAADARPTTEATESDVQEGTSASTSTVPGERVCSPGAARECKTFWYDHEGQLHCNLTAQICRADGYAWQTCGDLDAGPSPDAGTDAEQDDAGAR